MAKPLIVGTQDPIIAGEAMTEDLVSRNLNRFEGWKCMAGVENLYIDYDGRVWIANCASVKFHNQSHKFKDDPSKVTKWGLLGHIEQGFKIVEKQSVLCKMPNCGCGSDISITKWKKGHKPIYIARNIINIDHVEEPYYIRKAFTVPKQILWDLGRRCNYNCSYCWPGVHNTTDPFVTLETMMKTADFVHEEWADGNKIRWYFGGGEPTLNPDFEPFVEHLAERGDWVMLVTNGSQGPKYWEKNAGNYNTLIFSAHFEHLKEEMFVRNYVEAANQLLDENKKLETLIVKFMTKPGELERSQQLADRLKREIGWDSMLPFNKMEFQFDFVPLRGKELEDSYEMIKGYTKEEIITFSKMNNLR
jgi:MoaA/NifB/PqqE/SkfB family radical SAM enzyme